MRSQNQNTLQNNLFERKLYIWKQWMHLLSWNIEIWWSDIKGTLNFIKVKFQQESLYFTYHIFSTVKCTQMQGLKKTKHKLIIRIIIWFQKNSDVKSFFNYKISNIVNNQSFFHMLILVLQWNFTRFYRILHFTDTYCINNELKISYNINSLILKLKRTKVKHADFSFTEHNYRHI